QLKRQHVIEMKDSVKAIKQYEQDLQALTQTNQELENRVHAYEQEIVALNQAFTAKEAELQARIHELEQEEQKYENAYKSVKGHLKDTVTTVN
ncbi:MAG: hypothetical protein ACRCZG_02820, partial [Culicoidibacterales bacterium]